jgi:hypothetical protein
MSDTLEQELQAAFAKGLSSVSSDITERVRAIDYSPRRRCRLVIPLAGGATVFAGAVVALVLLLLFSSGTPDAFAGWTAVPAVATAPELGQAEAVCGNVSANEVLASEARGSYVAIVYTLNSSPWECVTRAKTVFVNQTTLDPPSGFANIGDGNVTLPDVTIRKAFGAALKTEDALLQRDGALNAKQGQPGTNQKEIAGTRRTVRKEEYATVTGPDSLTAVSGAVGPRVTGVTLVLADGQRVNATVKNNWYTAWWPGVRTHNAYPVSILVTSATGTKPAAFSRRTLTRLFAPCLDLNGCGSTSTIKLKPISEAQIKSHFRIFRAVPPASERTVRKLQIEHPEGAVRNNAAQARSVSFGHLGALVAIPLSNGVCLVIEPKGAAYCDNNAHSVISGLIVDSFVQDPPLSGIGSYWLVGLVPDGNSTVTIDLKSGRTVRLRVKDNLIFGKFKAAPTTITYAHPQRTLRYPITR